MKRAFPKAKSANDFRRPVAAGVPIDVECADGRLIEESDLQKLEELDDAVFAALDGDAQALDRSGWLWRRLQREAPPALLDESREQYIRRAESVFARYHDEPHDALAPAFAALEVLALMAE
ncbi:MAG: hypothetical protein AAF589_04750 [Planctomycetota bacterium]